MKHSLILNEYINLVDLTESFLTSFEVLRLCNNTQFLMEAIYLISFIQSDEFYL